jgi:hypothetical protein
MRRIRSRTPRLWCSAVVRMNWSFEIDRRLHMAWNCAATSSASACGSHAALGGGLRDLLPVLVHPDQEVDVVAAQAVIPRDGVRADLLERVPEVRIAVGVVDRGGEEEARGHATRRSSLARRRSRPPRHRCPLRPRRSSRRVHRAGPPPTAPPADAHALALGRRCAVAAVGASGAMGITGGASAASGPPPSAGRPRAARVRRRRALVTTASSSGMTAARRRAARRGAA